MATISVKRSIKIFCSAVDNNNVIEDNHLSFSFNSQFIFVHASQQVCQCQQFWTHWIYWVATSYLKLQGHFGGFLLISARLFFEVQCQLNPRIIYVFSVKPPGLQKSIQCSKTKGATFIPSSSTSSIFMPDEDTKSCWLYLLLISCLMSTLLSQGHAISVMRQFLFCWSTHTMSRRLWSSFISVYVQKSERNLKVLLSLTSHYYYHYYCCGWWCYYKHG